MTIRTTQHPWLSILERVEQAEPYRKLLERVRSSRMTHVTGAHGSLLAIVGSLLRRDLDRQCVLVVGDDSSAEELKDDAVLLFGDEHVRLLGHGMGRKAKVLDMSSSVAQTEAVKTLTEEWPVLVVASVRSFAAALPDPGTFRSRTFELRKGEDVSFEELPDRLASLGFERKEFVEEYGDFAVRGGIMDIFPFMGTQPIRFEFWGDSVESIRAFDVASQRSTHELEKASIVAGLAVGESGTSTVLDYLRPEALLLFEEPALLRKSIDDAFNEGTEGLTTWTEMETQIAAFARVDFSSIGGERGIDSVDMGSVSQPSFAGSTKQFLAEITKLNAEGFDIYVGSDTPLDARRLKELVLEELKPEGAREEELGSLQPDEPALPFHPIAEALHHGFVFRPGRFALFVEHEVFGRRRRRGSVTKRKAGLTQKELQQLQRGDHVVHQDFGIGTFAGLYKIKVRGAEQEVMKVVYAGGDAIYVNLNFVNRVQKYSSREGHVPTISRLGTQEWDRLKLKVRKKVKDIARDLIKLYARRKREPGHAFGMDTHWQKEMEAAFQYEDTPDQAAATVSVKMDMEEPSPMDRLICGDVGFGKTEVAVRAAFKSVMDGKQVAVLVPTTILARQHLLTFLDRVGRYGVRVESLSRLKTRKEQSDVLLALREGRVDIVIGTHRILSKDVFFKDLGLLIVDEEHRFGVAAKEKLRQMRVNVDTLTLTATPIPRTLQFSLLGARDLSLITTPPLNRLPIVTEIVPYNTSVIREAILHEIHRGGQIYVIHDRIHSMEEMRILVERIVPEARVATAHGQMEGKALEKVVMDFLDRTFNVLVCTKIIESGIDIPSVNTIVINRADRFGLAELYQLRGRVGRSNVQAYAYLLTPPIESLPRQAIRRLQALEEFTELGSGFNLAMRDLEIRGAGNLLGAEQSGFILEMGFELYQRIVAEAVEELREEEFPDLVHVQEHAVRRPVQTVVDADVEALIPEIYVESDAERLDLYRRMYAFETVQEVEALRTELRDRFGAYPEEVEHILLLVELKIVAGGMLIKGIEITGEKMVVTLPGEESKEFYDAEPNVRSRFQRMMDLILADRSLRGRLRQSTEALKLEITPGKGNDEQRLMNARVILERIRATIGESSR